MNKKQIDPLTQRLIILLLSMTTIFYMGSINSYAQESVNDKILVYELFNQIYEGSQPIIKKETLKDSIQEKPFQVLGWHIESSGENTIPYNFNVLTSLVIAGADLKMRNKGISIVEPIWGDNETSKLISLANFNSTAVYYSFKITDSNVLNLLLNDSNARVLVKEKIISILKSFPKLSGISIDFNGVSTDEDMKLLTFLDEISRKIHDANREIIITLASKPDYDQAFFMCLNDMIDWLIFMANDYHISSSQPAPMAPLNSGSSNISNSVRRYIDLAISPKKIIVTLPYEGVKWKGTGNILSFVDKLEYSEVMKEIGNETKYIDYAPDSNHAFYTSGKYQTQYEYLFDNEVTLKKKFQWIQNEELGGFGIWALGYDQNRPELWDMLAKDFLKDTALIRKTKEEEVVISQNDSTNNNTIDYVALEAEAQAKYQAAISDLKNILRQKEVVFTIGILVPFFLVIAFVTTILKSSFLEKILIRELPVFLKSLGFLLSLVIVCIVVASFVFEQNYEAAQLLQDSDKETVLISGSVINQVIKIGALGLLILLLISSKALMKINRDLP